MGLAFFISDAHIGAEDEDRRERKNRMLAKFFEKVYREGEVLFIVGDFFDFWFDYKAVLFTEHFEALCWLHRLAQRGVELHVFGGNHDWWFRDDGFFAQKLSAKIYREPSVVELFGRRFLIGHGDGLARSDWSYRLLLRPLLRNRLLVSLFRLVPAEWARALARLVSAGSRTCAEKYDLKRKRNERFEPEYEEFARRALAEDVDFVVLGHLHIPVVKEFEGGVYVNLGDFFENFTYGRYDGDTGRFELLRIEP